MNAMKLLVAVSALVLAGCSGPAATPATSPATVSTSLGGVPGGDGMALLVPPASGQSEHDGLRLHGAEDKAAIADGETVMFRYNATNIGADATKWGGCYRPYAFTLKDESGKDHPLQVPMAQCLGFTSDPFPAGATMGFQATWNGTYAEGEQYVKAPEGAYEFIATFTAYRGAEEGEEATVTLSLPIGVLPPGSMA